MMRVVFTYDGVAGDRTFRDVVSLETGEYEHPNGTGTEATISQLYEGEVETFPVRGYADIEIRLQDCGVEIEEEHPQPDPAEGENVERAEIEAERRAQERYERHVDRQGYF